MITITTLEDLTQDQITQIESRSGARVTGSRTIECDNLQVEDRVDRYLEAQGILVE